MSQAGITREKAYDLLIAHLKSPNLIKHCLASEAILRTLAPRFCGDPEGWGITGLVHDIDLELVEGDPVRHAEVGADMMIEAGLSPEYAEAIRRHKAPPEQSERTTTLDHALAAAETITGLIVATALVYPDKKLASVKSKSIRKRMGEPRFAAGANRDHIRECETIGLALDEFIDLSLEAMKQIAPDLGL